MSCPSFRHLLLLGCATLSLLVSPTATRIVPRQPPNNDTLTWTDCPNSGPFRPANKTMSLGLKCANVSVPLNYHDNPKGIVVTILVTKLPAKGKRIGNLFVNPGGPGSPASSQVVFMAQGRLPVGDAVLRAFDIIGMDPRGVGLSSGIRCSMDIANEPSDFDATTPDGFQKYFDYNKAVGESCRNMTGDLFDNMDTIATAKDLEAVRVAMGNESMNFLGMSYGTQLGAQYAALFPDKVRAMALDGVLQHTGSYAANVVTQTTSLDTTIQAFFNFCDNNGTVCGLSKGQNIREVWDNVTSNAINGTLKARDCDGTNKTGCVPDVSVSNILGKARRLLEIEKLQPRLAMSLLRAQSGNATDFADGLLTGDAFTDNSAVSIQTIQCEDGHFVAAKDHFEVQRIADLTRTFTVTPGMGEFWRRVITCTGYPVKVTNPRAALSVKGTQNPVLLIHSRFDPATSLVYAQGMLEEIQNSTLLFRDGLGHTSYFAQGNAAMAIDSYLVNLTVPPPGTVVAS